MTNSWLNLRVAWMLALALILLSCGGEPVDDEARIRQRIDDMVKAAEAKELGNVMEPIAEEFLGNKRIRKMNLKGLVLLHFRRHKNVHVFVNDIEVVLKHKKAEVTCNVVMAGRNQTLPESGRILRVTSIWEKRDDDWYVLSASWEDPIMNM
ncbi:MAG: hypothetical protein PVG20_03080 [Thioalkalispiraceae bacterium]